jgi:hypothetical protein
MVGSALLLIKLLTIDQPQVGRTAILNCMALVLIEELQPLTCALGVCSNAQHALVVGLRVDEAAGVAAAAGWAPREALAHHLQALGGTPAGTNKQPESRCFTIKCGT